MSESSKPLLLVVEDDKRLNMINRNVFEAEGYAVQSAFTLAQARLALRETAPDIILLDVKLPDGSGFDLCREIREETTAHIIFLTSVTEASGEMEGLISGGDDYLRKPYRIELLRERVKSILRRREIERQKLSRRTAKGTITFDAAVGRAFLKGEDMLLTPKEFTLLLLFAENEDKTVSAEYLYETAWKAPIAGGINSLQAIISKLRRKIEDSGYDIVSRRGQGYTFTCR